MFSLLCGLMSVCALGRGTINELTTKLSLCASTTDDRKYDKGSSWGKEKQNTMGDVPRDPMTASTVWGKPCKG
ncbi:hypothetical protein KUCAC02_027474 [Chaenocephalus aceratus]|uniref:Uncharacterized protein n=1 Tax=Chaenocephalus aceratus TaxID=36190 RepID=A0ACB9W3W4_CHAAC|nr:hypothetical protein KUCAC02_027474 [Chaenocephalus aceratus]